MPSDSRCRFRATIRKQNGDVNRGVMPAAIIDCLILYSELRSIFNPMSDADSMLGDLIDLLFELLLQNPRSGAFELDE